MRPNAYFPQAVHPDHVVATLVYLLEHITSNSERAARDGFTFVCDMKNWGWSNFSVQYANRFFAILSRTFPVRYIHLALARLCDVWTVFYV